MSYFRVSIIVAVLSLVIGMGTPQPVLACSCAAESSQEESFENAEAVFVGRVLSIDEHRGVARQLMRTLSFIEHRPSYRTVTFHATERWKGVDVNLIAVASGFGGGDCGFHFAEGERYLVYAHDGDFYGEDLATGICTRTEVLRHAGEDINALGPGDTSFTDEESVYNPTESPLRIEIVGSLIEFITAPFTRIMLSPWYVAFGIIALYLTPPVVLAYWLLRRRKH